MTGSGQMPEMVQHIGTYSERYEVEVPKMRALINEYSTMAELQYDDHGMIIPLVNQEKREKMLKKMIYYLKSYSAIPQRQR